MDHLWQEVHPSDSMSGGGMGAVGSGFDLSIVTPIDSGHPSEQQVQQQQLQQQQYQQQLAKRSITGAPVKPPPPVFVGKLSS